MYHSDEDELISDWLLYHASIFGASNIHVVDHNSTLPAVVETLREWERRGVEVIHTPPGFSFADKALLLTEVGMVHASRCCALLAVLGASHGQRIDRC